MIRLTKMTMEHLVCLMAVCVVTSAFTADYDISVDGSETQGDVPHFWSRCCGTGGAQLCLRDEWKVAAKIGVEEAGFKAYRGHLILSASNPLRWSGGGTPTYDWAVFDKIYDFLVDTLGTVPVVELSAQPPDLATSGEWSRPKDLNVYQDMIKNVVAHCLERYGEERVSRWYWEVWNEWDYSGFWTNGNEQQYYDMYKHAVLGATSAYPDVLIGGPSTTGSHDNRLVNFINYCKQNDLKVDFVSNHAYGGGGSGPSADPANVRHDNRTRSNNIKNSGLQLVSMNTEYNTSYAGQGGKSAANLYSMDNHINAPFIAKTVKLILDDHTSNAHLLPEVFSYWAISDVFDEGSYIENHSFVPFGQVFGLINYQGVRKAAFNAFKLLHMMGTTRISLSGGTGDADGVDGFATVNDDNSQAAVMVYNFYKDLAGQTGVDNVNLTVSSLPLPEGEIEIHHYRIDETHSNAYKIWEDLGKPGRPSDAQWDELHAASELAELNPVQTIDYSGDAYTETFSLPRQGLSMLLFTSKDAVTTSRDTPRQKVEPAYSLTGTMLRVADAHERPVEVALYRLDGKIVSRLQMLKSSCDLRNYLPKGMFLVGVREGGTYSITKVVVDR